MKKNVLLLLAATLLLGLSSCKNSGITKVSATGSIYECLVVMNNTALTESQLALIRQDPELGIASGSAYDQPISTGYELVAATMGASMPCMPQVEPYFKITHVPPKAFDDILKPSRNILIIDIDSTRYTQAKAKQQPDIWSHPQAVCHIQAPDMDSFVQYWLANGTTIRDWYVRSEFSRQLRFYRGATDKAGRKVLNTWMGMDLWIPEDYMLIDSLQFGDEQKALWFCNNKGSLRRDLVVYSYPYYYEKDFTLEALNKERDNLLSQFITASVPGSYMGTEYKVFPPRMRYVEPLEKDSTYDPRKFYGLEIRGLWKIYNGEAMGGPYVSLTRLDEKQQRIVTAEIFVFAPGQKKRNALRQAEAVLYSWKWL